MDFENYEEAAKAMREKDHKVFHEKFGDRYVRLIQVRGVNTNHRCGHLDILTGCCWIILFWFYDLRARTGA